jgi:hypothetical protein
MLERFVTREYHKETATKYVKEDFENTLDKVDRLRKDNNPDRQFGLSTDRDRGSGLTY